jgi:hypothetical protein
VLISVGNAGDGLVRFKEEGDYLTAMSLMFRLAQVELPPVR